MSETVLLPPEPATSIALSHRNGKEQPDVRANRSIHSHHTTLEFLPGSAVNLTVQTTGEQLGRLFTEQPDLPGAILFDDDSFKGVISQSHYYKCISRAFGREIYHRRPCAIMLSEVTEPPLVLSSGLAINAAVQRCLTRQADFVYEPFLVHDEKSGDYLLCAFQDLLLASSQLATLRNRQMEQILNSVTDGLLVIDRDFRIGGEYSKVVGKIFERDDLGDVPLPDVLQPLLDHTTYEQVNDYLRILFDPKLIDRLIKTINPARQISARFPSVEERQEKRMKHFAINFERIRVQTEISQVLVRIEDITQRMDLAKELEQQEVAAEEKLHLVMQILQVEPDELKRFMDRFDEALPAVSEVLDPKKAKPTPDAIHPIFRQIHTLKGEASLLQLKAQEKALHQLEDHLDKIRSAPPNAKIDLTAAISSLEVLERMNEQIHGALEQLKQLGAGPRPNATAKTTEKDAVTVAAPKQVSLIDTLTRMISDLSKRLEKPTTFHTTVTDRDFPPQHTEVLHEVLIHLTRNSMVHGIEPVEDRVKAGKSPSGLIQLEVKTHPEFYEIIFQDDGQGLDYDRIRQRAEKLGWNLTTEEQLRNAIFEPGFSTAEKVTDLAGRGVGLDAIRHSLSAVGGRILPYSETGAYCAFQVLLPKASILPVI